MEGYIIRISDPRSIRQTILSAYSRGVISEDEFILLTEVVPEGFEGPELREALNLLLRLGIIGKVSYN